MDKSRRAGTAMLSRRQHAGARLRRAWAWRSRTEGIHHMRCNEELGRLGPSAAAHARRLRACLVISFSYLVLVCVALVLRLEFHKFGFSLRPHELVGLRQALDFHAVGVAVVGCLIATARIAKTERPLAAKLALAFLPVILVASLDRLVAIKFKSIGKEDGPFISHATRGWTNRPGWTGLDANIAFRINSNGFRGPEIPKKKTETERRILFLGDSVTFGSGVAEASCFVARVEQLVRQSTSNAKITTINASVPAYTPCHEFDLLVNEGMRVEPDVVVHVFCLNDVLGKFQFERFGGFSRGYEPPPRSRLEWSGFFRAVRRWQAGIDRPDKDRLWYLWSGLSAHRLLHEPDAPVVDRGWTEVFEDMDKIVELTRQASVPLVIVCPPHRDQLLEEGLPEPSPQTVLSKYAANKDVPFLDLLPVFHHYASTPGADPTNLYISAMHLSPAGHELVADAIFRFLSVLEAFD